MPLLLKVFFAKASLAASARANAIAVVIPIGKTRKSAKARPKRSGMKIADRVRKPFFG
jgi:hypothetical protein